MMANIGEDLKKVMLVGIGAMAATAEKSKELVDELVKKGELTVEQGKVLNQELKHKVKEAVKENVTVNVTKQADPEDILSQMDSMSPEELKAIQEKLEKLNQPAE